MSLPIAAYRSDILAAVRDHAVTIITAETGAGKSTQVPQYLLDEGYNLVVTQPRRLATRTVAARVAEEFGTPFGEIVGYRTAYERQDSEATRCLFVTDGLGLARELGTGNNGVLVVDEVHEWNTNIEVLVAWAKRQMEADSEFKLVLMSATLEAEKLASYFGGAPVISVPGRTFPVEERRPGKSLLDDTAELLRRGRNVLVFQPGKAEIDQTIAQLKDMGVAAEILPLHGQLSTEEQSKCFRSYSIAKCVVSTNVAQTSVTIPDIDAVVDSGMERRVETIDGVEGLYLKAISHADSAQRKGRAGRTKPGVYIDWCATPWDDRLEFPKAEILRVELSSVMLRLAEAGFDMEELQFFHQPDPAELAAAKRSLFALGCTTKSGDVTPVGHRVAKMSVSVRYGRMVVEADKLGVVDDVLTVAAILEQGGIAARACGRCRSQQIRRCSHWQDRLAEGERDSDVIAQMHAYQACQGMTKTEMHNNGISVKAYYQAKEKRRNLARNLQMRDNSQDSGDREAILRAVCAGLADNLYHYRGAYWGRDQETSRQLAHESVVSSGADWLVGVPFDLHIKGGDGMRVLHLLTMATKVQPTWLAEVAPQLVETVRTSSRYDSTQDEVVSTTEIWFDGRMVETIQKLDPDHPEATQLRRDGRTERQWENWEKPDIPVSNMEDLSSTIPEVATETYGFDPESGDALLAYGAVDAISLQFYFRWTRSRKEAEAFRLRAVSNLATLHENLRNQQKAMERAAKLRAEKGELAELAHNLCEQAKQLLDQPGDDEDIIPDDLYDELEQASHPIWSTDVSTLRVRTQEAQRTIDRVKQTVADAEKRSHGVASTSDIAALAAMFNNR